MLFAPFILFDLFNLQFIFKETLFINKETTPL